MEGLLSETDEMTMLISSHELGEIEHLATHVGFLDGGKMLIEASMDDLHERIREVHVTLEAATLIPERLPKEWLRARTFGNVLSFVDTHYAQADLHARIRALLGPVRRIETQSLPLRSVFTTLARAAREGVIQ
jgi:ABC-2 type transport system ATP-binding protein